VDNYIVLDIAVVEVEVEVASSHILVAEVVAVVDNTLVVVLHIPEVVAVVDNTQVVDILVGQYELLNK
jgi:hypothetical protein